MEIQIYYSLKEFKENYEKDFEKFKVMYPDSTLEDFFKDRKRDYEIAIENVTTVDAQQLGIKDRLFLTVAELKGEGHLQIENKLKEKNIDYDKYLEAKKLKYSFERIIEFLREKSNENGEINNTDETKTQIFSVPEIIKILDKLNIRGIMQEKGYSDFQTVQLLADIFGRSEKSIRNNFINDKHSQMAENYLKKLKDIKAKR